MPSGLALELNGKVPVFVFPTSLKFYLDDHTTHKKIITIYNPYDFAVRFKILCTNRDKYVVIDPDGSIKPHYCIDVVIRHVDIKPSNCNVTDKFRIQLQDHLTRALYNSHPKQTGVRVAESSPLEHQFAEDDYYTVETDSVIGKRDIPSILMGGIPDDLSIQTDRETAFESLPPIPSELAHASHHYSIQNRSQDVAPGYNGSNYIVILTGLVCAIALLMPNEGETSVIPVHLSLNLKLVFSYILGLVTMVIFRA